MFADGRSRVLFLDEVVERELAGAEDEDQHADSEVNERVRIIKLCRIGEEIGERVAIGGDVGGEHVDREAKRRYARKQANGEQNPGDEFERRYKRCGGSW